MFVYTLFELMKKQRDSRASFDFYLLRREDESSVCFSKWLASASILFSRG